MKQVRAVLLMSSESALRVCDVASKAGVQLQATIAESKPALLEAFTSHHDLLLSFGTSIIVPEAIVSVPYLLALNVHAASPLYPGRDPHHFAAYDGATEYGATMHYMTSAVDAGPIVDVELFSVRSETKPHELLNRANEAGWRLINRFFRRYAAGGRLEPMNGFAWRQRKTTRKMFTDLCRVSPEMGTEEILRRHHAVSMPGYCNLYIDLAGLRFRAEEIVS